MKIIAWWTTLLAYCLMVLGNVVSATGSGLACPDWPLCHGTIAPELRFDIILEWGHRVLAAVVTPFILATVYLVWKNQDQYPNLKRPLKFLLSFIGVQIILGGITVMLHLSTWISSIHLLLATLLFSALITVCSVITYKEDLVVLKNSEWEKKFRNYAVILMVLLFFQFGLGALIRHSGAGLACPNFPTCLEGFWPIPLTLQTGVHFLHRWIGIFLIGAFIHLLVANHKIKSTTLSPFVWAISLIAVVQVILGIITVTSGLDTLTRAVHAALGYALWALTLFTTLRAGGFRWLWTKA